MLPQAFPLKFNPTLWDRWAATWQTGRIDEKSLQELRCIMDREPPGGEPSVVDVSDRSRLLKATRAQLESLQLPKLQRLLDLARQESPFYRERLRDAPVRLQSVSDWKDLPTTEKEDLIDPDHPMGLARHHRLPVESYARYHRTSGTMGKPLVMLDTKEDWQWWRDTWQWVLDAAQVTKQDRVLMAFSFGPFIGFWSAHDACLDRGAMVIPAGGLSTSSRLDLLLASQATVLASTPSYALHLTELALERNLPIASSRVRTILVAGEPGGSQQAVRRMLESSWDAKVIDHAGATELGPWGFGDSQGAGLRVIETEFFAEFLPWAPAVTKGSAEDGGIERSDGDLTGIPLASPDALYLPSPTHELVLTPLGRFGSPLIRYRTGDLVRPVFEAEGLVRLEGGILGRRDAMWVIRGVNIYPGSVETILRSECGVNEFQVRAVRRGSLDQLEIDVEPGSISPPQIAQILHARLALRVDVREVAEGSLPRSEGKAKRFHDQRPSSAQSLHQEDRRT
ncbi:MAG: phenylacetate--CoA ligase family protein [Pirellulaceae bacterium]